MSNLVPERVGVSAHRGLRLSAAENSWEAFTALVEATTNGVPLSVEFDIRATRDGALVIIHDADFNGAVLARHTYRELQELAGGQCPPLLESVVGIFRGAGIVQINAEIKAMAGLPEALRLLDQLKGENVLLSSFDVDVVEHFMEASPHFASGLLLDPLVETDPTTAGRLRELLRLNPDALIPEVTQITPELSSEVRAMGKALGVYTLNDPEVMVAWIESRMVDWIITDVPEVLLPQLHSFNLQSHSEP